MCNIHIRDIAIGLCGKLQFRFRIKSVAYDSEKTKDIKAWKYTIEANAWSSSFANKSFQGLWSRIDLFSQQVDAPS